jgi:hypothetical protein
MTTSRSANMKAAQWSIWTKSGYRLNPQWCVVSNVVRAQELRVNGQAVVGQRQPAISGPSGGTTQDSECRTAVSSILGALRAHGLIG